MNDSTIAIAFIVVVSLCLLATLYVMRNDSQENIYLNAKQMKNVRVLDGQRMAKHYNMMDEEFQSNYDNTVLSDKSRYEGASNPKSIYDRVTDRSVNAVLDHPHKDMVSSHWRAKPSQSMRNDLSEGAQDRYTHYADNVSASETITPIQGKLLSYDPLASSTALMGKFVPSDDILDPRVDVPINMSDMTPNYSVSI